MRNAAIVSTGVYVPDREVTNAQFAERLPPAKRELVWKLERSTGVRTRWYAPDDWSTSDLALPAAQQALERAGLDPEDLDLVIVGTDTPDYISPATSVVLQHKLGAKRAGTFDVGCACASFPTAVAAASGIIATSPGIDTVLVASAYLMRRFADPEDPIGFFYGDGAGAVVIRRSDEPGFLCSSYRADGSFAKMWAIESGGTVEPAGVDAVLAGRTHIRMRERYPRWVNEQGWPDIVRELAQRGGFSLGDVDLFVFTQVRAPTIETVMEDLGADPARAHMVMDRYGYTGSACIPMALHDAVEAGKARTGDLVVLVGSGVGYSQAGVALRLSADPRGQRAVRRVA